MPINISAGIGAASAIGQAGLGIYQMIKGHKMAKNNVRPDYQIPQEVYQNLSDAQRMAMEGLPAAQKEQYIQNLQRSSQFGLRGASDRKAGLAGLSSLVQNQNDAYGNLLSKDAAARMQNQQTLYGMRNALAQQKTTQWDYNKYQPFMQKAQAAQAMQGAGMQNAFGALSTAGQTANTFATNNMYKDYLKQMAGNDNPFARYAALNQKPMGMAYYNYPTNSLTEYKPEGTEINLGNGRN